jgi:hypothetical protein
MCIVDVSFFGFGYHAFTVAKNVKLLHKKKYFLWMSHEETFIAQQETQNRSTAVHCTRYTVHQGHIVPMLVNLKDK